MQPLLIALGGGCLDGHTVFAHKDLVHVDPPGSTPAIQRADDFAAGGADGLREVHGAVVRFHDTLLTQEIVHGHHAHVFDPDDAGEAREEVA